MRILSRLPERRAPMAAATSFAPAVRRDRSDAFPDRRQRRPIQTEERPTPVGAPRGVAVATLMGAAMWAGAIVALLIF